MATTNPNLGYGKQTEANINDVNTWMRSTPWYQAQMRAWGQDPGHPTLTKSQSQQILKMAQAQGVVVDQKDMEVDNHGNFNPIGHKLRNTLIVAGIAGATLATLGAAGAFSGAAGAGAAGGGSAAGTTAGSSLAGVGLGETGATAGLAGSGFGALPVGVEAAGTAIPGSGIGSALGVGGKIAALGKAGQAVGNGIYSATHGGQDPELQGIAAANAAAQAAQNRILAAKVDQGGPTADDQSISNMRRAGLISNFQDTAPSAFGSPAIKIGDQTRAFASQFQNELAKRMAAGKSLTLSGVPDPGAQELEDERRARLASQGKTGNGVLDALNTGGRLAGLAPGIIRGARDIWSIF